MVYGAITGDPTRLRLRLRISDALRLPGSALTPTSEAEWEGYRRSVATWLSGEGSDLAERDALIEWFQKQGSDPATWGLS
jgi:hypothetical protein